MLENISEETLIGLRINKEIIDKSKKNIVNWIIADIEYEEVIIYSKGWWKWYCIFSIIEVRRVYERIKIKEWDIIKDEMKGRKIWKQ